MLTSYKPATWDFLSFTTFYVGFFANRILCVRFFLSFVSVRLKILEQDCRTHPLCDQADIFATTTRMQQLQALHNNVDIWSVTRNNNERLHLYTAIRKAVHRF